jgi:hypothetical protein
MMGTLQTAGRAFLVVRPVGAQPKFDIAAVASKLAGLQRGAAPLRVLFDWSQVGSWPFAVPPSTAVRDWNNTAPPIARAAFVHDSKWNRHAAILSALLRVSGAEARSFSPSNADSAIEWLERPAEGVDIGPPPRAV